MLIKINHITDDVSAWEYIQTTGHVTVREYDVPAGADCWTGYPVETWGHHPANPDHGCLIFAMNPPDAARHMVHFEYQDEDGSVCYVLVDGCDAYLCSDNGRTLQRWAGHMHSDADTLVEVKGKGQGVMGSYAYAYAQERDTE